MKFFQKKGPSLPDAADPDEDLASDAGFEIGVSEPSATQKAVKTMFGRFSSRKAQPEDENKNVLPKFKVQEVVPSTKKQAASTPEEALSSNGSTDKDRDDSMMMEDQDLNDGYYPSKQPSPMQEKTRAMKHSMENWYHDEDRRQRWRRAFPYCVCLCFCLLLALLLGIIFGLQGNQDRNNSPPTTLTTVEKYGEAGINVLLELDDQPQEIGWMIYVDDNRTDTREIVHQVPTGTYNSTTTNFLNEFVGLEWGQHYVFEITDEGKDGLSSGQGGKWLLVFRSTEMAVGEDDWGSVDVVFFYMNENMGLVNVTGWQKGSF